MKVLITGFDAFGGLSFNPSEELIKKLIRSRPLDSFEEIEALVLPTQYVEASRAILFKIEHWSPDYVIMFGLANDADSIRLERFALNIADVESADNAGDLKVAETIIGDGPTAYQTDVPLERIKSVLWKQGIDAEVSNHAGAYVCNYVYYQVLHNIRRRPTKALFVHVPLRSRRTVQRVFSEGDLTYLLHAARVILRVLRDDVEQV
jgi:pyroglutamyl-peptidase